MTPDDKFIDMPPTASAEVIAAIESTPFALLNAEEIGEAEIYACATHVYAHLISVPRSFAEQTALDLEFQRVGYQNATHAFQVGAVEAAFNLRDAIKKRLEKEGGEPNDGAKL